jgi:chromosome segregation ATPase
MDESYKFLGILAGIGMVVIPMAKWLISDYFKKSEKLEKIKNDRVKKIEDDSSHLRNCLDELKNILRVHGGELKNNSQNITSLKDRLDEHQRDLKYYTQNLHKHVDKTIKTEIVQLKNELVRVRGVKKDGDE